MGIYLAIRHFQYFIEGRAFTIFTDHAPIRHSLFARAQHASPRQQRHLDFIAQFTTDIRHVEGEKNVVADALSRITASILEEFPAINFLEMAIAQQHDVSTMNLQRSANSLRIETRFLSTHGVTILGDTSTDQFRSLVPQKFRKAVFDIVHSLAHPGIKSTQKAISQRYVWAGMHHDVKLWCRSCIACQQSKIQRHTISPLQSFPPSSEKFQHIHVDIVGPLPESCGCSYLLTITDRFSRWVEALPLTDITAKSCADAFVLHFVARYGAPYTITTDRGTIHFTTVKRLDQLQNSTPSQNFNLRPRQEQNSFASHSRPPPRRRYTNPRNTYRPRFQVANTFHSNYYNHGTPENQLCFYHHFFGPRARKCQPPCNRRDEKAKNVSAGHRGSVVSNQQ